MVGVAPVEPQILAGSNFRFIRYASHQTSDELGLSVWAREKVIESKHELYLHIKYASHAGIHCGSVRVACLTST
jgi:hypothetical protein